MTTILGRFDHHPEPAIDFCIEVEVLLGMEADIMAGLESVNTMRPRVEKALMFRVGGDAHAVAAKDTLRALAKRAFPGCDSWEMHLAFQDLKERLSRTTSDAEVTRIREAIRNAD